jgi:hypothetical protein
MTTPGNAAAMPPASPAHTDEQVAATPLTSKADAMQDTPEVVSKIDAIVTAYLQISQTLGAPQTSDAPMDAAPLVAAAHQLHAEWLGQSSESLAVNVAKAGEALKREPLNRQREMFKALSDAVITLVEQHPPSPAVGDMLYVMYCPMAPGHWMQTIDRVNNPFYATQMKQCGEMVGTVTTVRRGDSEQ